MLGVKILIVGFLVAIFLQDIRSRSVAWVLFPLLAAAFIALRLLNGDPIGLVGITSAFSFCFLVVNILLLTLYFSVRRGRLVDLSKGLLCWGDLLFLVCLCFYLPFLNYLLFYLGSLLLVIFFWTLARFASGRPGRHIPLAGLQALLLASLLVAAEFVTVLDIAHDDWLAGILNHLI